jgi:hypothetical protein
LREGEIGLLSMGGALSLDCGEVGESGLLTVEGVLALSPSDLSVPVGKVVEEVGMDVGGEIEVGDVGRLKVSCCKACRLGGDLVLFPTDKGTDLLDGLLVRAGEAALFGMGKGTLLSPGEEGLSGTDLSPNCS